MAHFGYSGLLSRAAWLSRELTKVGKELKHGAGAEAWSSVEELWVSGSCGSTRGAGGVGEHGGIDLFDQHSRFRHAAGGLVFGQIASLGGSQRPRVRKSWLTRFAA